ncbi:MAG: PQQ-binding-like beta-propeller repeat protein [Gammaproteobacteria bacterium]|nr:PQQ-binding-like beta-propeller repeat protein [Gammaproteobacteria bacterium]
MKHQYGAPLVLIALAAHLTAQATETDAAAGRVIYESQCVECHGGKMQGSGHGPELSGTVFINKWGNRTVHSYYRLITDTMPGGQSGSLDEAEAHTVAAYVLQVNAADLSDAIENDKTIGEVLLGDGWDPSQAIAADQDSESWEGAGSIAEAARQASDFVNETVKNYTPVSSEMLADPPDSDWLSWRRTLNGWGYSPLDEITRDNIAQLSLAWVIAMRDGSNQGTPLIHDGIMYLTHPQNVVQALDAASGDVIWEYSNSYEAGSQTLGGPTRSIAIYEDTLFMATYDAAIVAIDARTGEERWKTVKADWNKGFTHTSGPIVADGVVISGINGCERYKPEGCFITAHDPDTGAELWRTSTIALPGDKHDDSWGGLPTQLRAGSDTWIPGSYDPESRLFYIGTSQAKPWVAASRGMSPNDAALYTNSTLALDPATGEIKWHFQHVSGETLDMETGFERVLVDLDGKKQLVTIGKDGILWKLDRQSGDFVALTETMRQTLYADVNRNTGKLTYRQDIIDAGIGDAVNVCPSIYGGHNWQATAYDPDNRSLVIPLHRLCVEMTGREVEMTDGGGGYGGESKVYPMPDANGMLGRLTAYDLETMEQKWNHTQRAMFLTGALTTAGGLTFIGDMDRWFRAFDTNTGEELWKVRLGAGLHGFPVSYAVDGTQYIAVLTGMGVFKLLTAKQAPEIYQPNGGNALYVFKMGN